VLGVSLTYLLSRWCFFGHFPNGKMDDLGNLFGTYEVFLFFQGPWSKSQEILGVEPKQDVWAAEWTSGDQNCFFLRVEPRKLGKTESKSWEYAPILGSHLKKTWIPKQEIWEWNPGNQPSKAKSVLFISRVQPCIFFVHLAWHHSKLGIVAVKGGTSTGRNWSSATHWTCIGVPSS
jgi:hypothetical protein